MPKAIVYVQGDAVDFQVGKEGITNLFTDKESGHLVVLSDEGIAEYAHPYTLYRDYAKKKEA